MNTPLVCAQADNAAEPGTSKPDDSRARQGVASVVLSERGLEEHCREEGEKTLRGDSLHPKDVGPETTFVKPAGRARRSAASSALMRGTHSVAVTGTHAACSWYVGLPFSPCRSQGRGHAGNRIALGHNADGAGLQCAMNMTRLLGPRGPRCSYSRCCSPPARGRAKPA